MRDIPLAKLPINIGECIGISPEFATEREAIDYLTYMRTEWGDHRDVVSAKIFLGEERDLYKKYQRGV